MIAVFKYLKITPRKRGLCLFLVVSWGRMRSNFFYHQFFIEVPS